MMSSDKPQAANVVDFQVEALGRMRTKMARLDEEHAQLLAFARGNQGATAQVQTAVLAALDADSFEHLIHIVTADWVDILGLDGVVVLLETGNQHMRATASGIQLMKSGDIAKLMPGDAPVILESTPNGAPAFGPVASLVGSQALIRLSLAKPLPNGVLALGSRQDHSFEGVASTALLTFLGAVLERCLTRWMTTTP
jgi:uncharacterized protein